MIHTNVPLPYSIEYAKSGRATCKKCNKNIADTTLRMSIVHPASFFDGNIDSWYHYGCFWKNLVRGQDEINLSSIRGGEWLRWEDQEDLRLKIQAFKAPYVHEPSPELINTLIFSELKTEKSATNRGKCTKCSTNFQRGEIKVFHKGKAVHFKCHLEPFEKIEGTIDEIPNWEDYDDCWKLAVTNDLNAFKEEKNLNQVEQATIPPEVSTNHESASDLQSVDSGIIIDSTQVDLTHDVQVMNIESQSAHDVQSSSNSAMKRVASEGIIQLEDSSNTGESEFSRKRRLLKGSRVAEIQQKRMKKQADSTYQLIDLFSSMIEKDRLHILKENGQEIPEGNNQDVQSVQRLSDYALYGCPIDCVKCTNGKLVYNSSRRTYVCTGYATEYSKCIYETKNPIRTPFIMPQQFYKKYNLQDVVFNLMSERLYMEGEEGEEVINTIKRQSRGGVHGDQFFYAAEQMDSVTSGIQIVANGNNSNTNTHIIKNGTLVDAKFPLAGQCHVLKNENDDSLYQATLSFTDLTQNKNSYYKIQLLKNDNYEQYYVFRAWGRVGTEVGDSLYNSYSKESAIESFEECFQEKTGNEWRYRKHFKKQAGKFNYVETDYSEFAELGEQDIIPGTKTRLPKSVKEVVMSIFDVENMKSALKSFEMDVNKMPLGRLSSNQINQAFQVLNDISDLLVELPVDNAKILDASNKFYTIIPHNFGMKVPEPIASLHMVKEKNNMLNALLDIKFAYDQIMGDNPTSGTLGVDPVDTNYNKLKCIMTPVERNCSDWNMINEYLINTQGSTHELKVDLVDILKLDRDNESSKFKRNIGNRKLLWHGSGKMNFAGILGQGLRIAPPEAPVSGYMFGKGVYFADMFSKSVFYCRANAKEEAYLLLCDVALGTSQTAMQATTYTKKTLPKNKHSVQGIGRECPNEIGDYHHPDGYLVPKGPRKVQLEGVHGQNYSLLYNEYIVYDVDQIQLKYLVRVKMHVARHR